MGGTSGMGGTIASGGLLGLCMVVLGGEGIEYEIVFKINSFHPQPGWRNWQTQRTQNPPTFGSWGFDSPSRHQA